MKPYRYLCLLLLCFVTVSQSFSQVNQDDYYNDEIFDNTNIPQKNKQAKPNKKQKNKKRLKTNERLFPYVGSTFSIGFTNSLFNFDLSPFVGYRYDEYLEVALGGTYLYIYELVNNSSLSVYKTRAFINVYPFSKISPKLSPIYLHLEGEYLLRAMYNSGSTTNASNVVTKPIPAVHLGLGYNSNPGKGFGILSEFLVDVLAFRANSVNPGFYSPWSYRIGFTYGF